MRFTALWVFGAAIFCGTWIPAHANLSASPIILEFEDGQADRKDITLTNTSERVQYLEISAVRITNLGEPEEAYFESPDPKEVGLLVAPRRIALKPNEQKLIRVIKLNKDMSTDQAWRVNILPVSGGVESAQSVVVTQLGYRALVYARPKTAMGRISGERQGHSLTVKNEGNTNIMLDGQEQCAPAGDNCQELPMKRLWPGQTWRTELPHDAPATFKLRGPAESETLTF